MIPLVVIGAIVVVPILLALVFRVHAVYVFLGICAGYLLQMALSDDVDLAFATIIHGSNTIVAARLTLLGLPVLLSIFVLRKTQGRSFIFQLVPLIFSGMLLGALALPLLPPGMEQDIYNAQYGSGIKQSQDLVIAAAAISNLVLAWMLFKKPKDHRKHH